VSSLRLALDEGQRDLRAREQEATTLEARLASLEELASSRAEFGDAARMVLREANGRVGQQGAVADYLDVEPAYERAVEAGLGELLQYVVVERHTHAAEGLSLVRGADAGRCGFVVVGDARVDRTGDGPRADGVRPVTEVARVSGPHAQTIHGLLAGVYVAESFDRAVAFAGEHGVPVATRDGDVLRGRHLVAGGARAESRGILATKREIRDLRARVAVDRAALTVAAEGVTRLQDDLGVASAAQSALQDAQHHEEKALVGHEARVGRALEARERHARRAEVIALEERRAGEERQALDARQHEAAASIASLETEQRQAEERLADAQRRLAERRDVVSALAGRVAEVSGLHAGLVERVTAVRAEV
jgi:chromosome segregation protein